MPYGSKTLPVTTLHDSSDQPSCRSRIADVAYSSDPSLHPASGRTQTYATSTIATKQRCASSICAPRNRISSVVAGFPACLSDRPGSRRESLPPPTPVPSVLTLDIDVLQCVPGGADVEWRRRRDGERRLTGSSGARGAQCQERI